LAGEVDVKIAREEGREKKRCCKQGGADPFHAPTTPKQALRPERETTIIGRKRMM